MFENLKTQYKAKFITKEQLQRYVALGRITQAECNLILKEVDDVQQNI